MNLRVSLLIVLLAVGASGCAFGRSYQNAEIDPSDFEQIRKGVTTREDILDVFGPPHRVVGARTVRTEERETSSVESSVRVASSSTRADSAAVWNVGKLASDGESIAAIDFAGAQGYQYRYYRLNRFDTTFFLLFSWFDFDHKYDELLVIFNEDDTVRYKAYRADTPRLRAAGFWFGEGG